MLDLKEKDGAVTLRIRVQPRARRTEIIGEHAGALKLKLAAPPVDGKANEECRRFLSKLLKVSTGSVEIISGESSREEVVRIDKTSAARINAVLLPIARQDFGRRRDEDATGPRAERSRLAAARKKKGPLTVKVSGLITGPESRII
jgi:uncharacterized protein (TIGR00251 family)